MSITQPSLSVLIITYNHEPFIEQALRSVFSQQIDRDVEIVVGEDHSTDRTRDIVIALQAESPFPLRLLERGQRLGMAANFQDTYRACRGNYIAFLEGDDYWTDPRKLARQAEALDQHPEWSLSFHRIRHVNQEGVPTGTVFPEECNPVRQTEDLLTRNFIQTCSVVIRRSALPEIPDWLLPLKLLDWPICILASLRGGLAFHPEVMADYRLHSGGVWSGKSDFDRYVATAAMFEQLRSHLDGRYSSGIRLFVADLLARAGLIASERGRTDEAASLMARAFEEHLRIRIASQPLDLALHRSADELLLRFRAAPGQPLPRWARAIGTLRHTWLGRQLKRLATGLGMYRAAKL